MAKLVLTDLTSLTNESSALGTMQANNAAVAAAMEKTLSRDGTSPNTMSASIDMNSNRILNLPAPVDNNEPARWVDIGNAPSYATAAAASATAAATSETNAATSATAAAASATSAAASVAALAGTSTTSLLIGTGAKTFTTQSGKLFSAGEYLMIASNANANNYMHGTVTSYSGTSLVMNITDIGGSGTLADWNISVSGTQGPTGATGPTGPTNISGTPTAGQLATWTNATTVQGTTTLPTAAVPTFAGGDVTSAGASLVLSIAAGVVTFAKLASAALATTAQYLANTASLVLTTDKVWGAGALVTLTDAASVTPDFSLGINFIWTIGATGRTIVNPSNPKVGQTGVIYLVQDGTGSRTITTWGTQYKFSGGTKPTLSTAASAVDVLSYHVKSATEIECFFTANMS